jgi:hypothetical protein
LFTLLGSVSSSSILLRRKRLWGFHAACFE